MRHGWIVVPAISLFTLLLALPATAGPGPDAGPPPLPDERLGIRTAPLLLLSRPDVRDDLKLTAKQVDDAGRAVRDLYARAAATKGLTGAQAVWARKAIDDAQRDWVIANLTPDQSKRLVQVDLQWEGPSALVSRPVVADTLGLSNEQRAAMTQAVAKRNAARALPTFSQADEQALARQTLSLLTPPQQERWRSMLGRPFAPRLASAKKDPAPGR